MSFKPTLEQQEIFDFFQNGIGNGMIDAVAGSGKTSTIIKGIDYIDKSKSILFCAFNKKIQEEINNKTKEKDNVIVKTTYALGLAILKRHFDAMRNKDSDGSKYFNIVNENLKKDNNNSYVNYNYFTEYFERIRYKYYSEKKPEEIDVFHKTFYSNCYRLIDLMRYTLSFKKGEDSFKRLVEKYSIDIEPEDNALMTMYRELIELAIEEGNNKAKEEGIYDFADMIFLPCEFKLRPQNQFDILFVDECQDLSNAQLKIIMKHIKKEGRLFAVGDPYQSIYGFAGASPESFNNIRTVFNPTMFKLTNCFRCSSDIVELAKEIRSDITTTNTFKSEIKKIKFNEIIKYVNKDDFIISRHNSNLFEVLFILLRNNVKCKIIGKNEILKSLKNIIPSTEFNNQRYYEDLPNHLQKIYRNAEIKLGKNPSNYDKLENLNDSINILETCFFHNDNAQTLNDLFLYIEGLMDGEDKDSVLLSSIHKAKGLERKNVFIIGYEKLPIKKENMLEWQVYQEKCLKYVAITRAEVTLYQTESPPDKNKDIESKEFILDEDCDLDDVIDNLPL